MTYRHDPGPRAQPTPLDAARCAWERATYEYLTAKLGRAFGQPFAEGDVAALAAASERAWADYQLALLGAGNG